MAVTEAGSVADLEAGWAAVLEVGSVAVTEAGWTAVSVEVSLAVSQVVMEVGSAVARLLAISKRLLQRRSVLPLARRLVVEW